MVLFHDTNDENTDSLVLKTNEKLDVDITENEIDRSHRIGRKKNGQKPRPIIVKLRRYNTRKKVFASKRNLKRIGVSITESLTAKRMEQLKMGREEHSFINVWTTDGRILFRRPNENKSNLFYDWKLICCFCVIHERKACFVYVRICFLFFILWVLHMVFLYQKRFLIGILPLINKFVFKRLILPFFDHCFIISFIKFVAIILLQILKSIKKFLVSIIILLSVKNRSDV